MVFAFRCPFSGYVNHIELLFIMSAGGSDRSAPRPAPRTGQNEYASILG